MTQHDREVDELVDELANKEYNREDGRIYTYGQIPHFVSNLRNLLTALTQQRQQCEEVVRDIIKMADELESECNRDGDKGTEQWRAFKGFRNAIRDKYLNPKDTV